MSSGLEELNKLLQTPLAYLEVKDDKPYYEPLLDHLAQTSIEIEVLFSNRLRVLEEKTRDAFNWERGELLEFAKAIGLLHDIGKASRKYVEEFHEKTSKKYSEKFQRKPCAEKSKLTFPQHEIVAGILIYHLSRDVEDFYTRRRAGLAARVIARHHAAMESRHPAKVRDRCKKEFLREVLEKIDYSVIEQVRAVCRGHELCEILSKKPESRVVREENLCTNFVEELARTSDAPKSADRVHDFILLNALTGMLVVADNLVAYRNRGSKSTTDGSTPLYVKHWLCELAGDCASDYW
ncbi:MAG: CRISPR-associated endonuclease Cas3'' [Thermosphaera sp.]|nr:CRISPR-associated endonuclease Cas3'' [Thermosphaera sp.]